MTGDGQRSSIKGRPAVQSPYGRIAPACSRLLRGALLLEGGHEYGEEEHAANDRAAPDIGIRQRKVDGAQNNVQERGAEDRPDDAALAAHQIRAAHDRGGDRVELIPA